VNLEEKILNQYTGLNEIYGQVPYQAFVHHMCCEREKKYKKLLSKKFQTLNQKTMLEIGAGSGDNLFFFNRAGIFLKDIFANELVLERIEWLGKHFHKENIIPGNILTVNIDRKFDIIFQSTVFSSVLQPNDRKAIADRMKQLLAPDGVILWYDFTFNNPKNKQVVGISKKEIKTLFSDARNIIFKRATLAPPIGRRVGEGYNFFNTLFPFFRTHLVALIEY